VFQPSRSRRCMAGGIGRIACQVCRVSGAESIHERVGTGPGESTLAVTIPLTLTRGGAVVEAPDLGTQSLGRATGVAARGQQSGDEGDGERTRGADA